MLSDHISSHMDQVAGRNIFWIPVSDKFKVQMRCGAAREASSAADTQSTTRRPAKQKYISQKEKQKKKNKA